MLKTASSKWSQANKTKQPYINHLIYHITSTITESDTSLPTLKNIDKQSLRKLPNYFPSLAAWLNTFSNTQQTNETKEEKPSINARTSTPNGYSNENHTTTIPPTNTFQLNQVMVGGESRAPRHPAPRHRSSPLLIEFQHPKDPDPVDHRYTKGACWFRVTCWSMFASVRVVVPGAVAMATDARLRRVLSSDHTPYHLSSRESRRLFGIAKSGWVWEIWLLIGSGGWKLLIYNWLFFYFILELQVVEFGRCKCNRWLVDISKILYTVGGGSIDGSVVSG